MQKVPRTSQCAWKKWPHLLCGCVALFVVIENVWAQDLSYSLAVEGVFHGNETDFQNGQSVWAFGEHGGEYVLERVTVSVGMREDPIADDDSTGIKTGKEIHISSLQKSLENIVLIDGMAGFSEGVLASAVLHQDCLNQANNAGGGCAIAFGSHTYNVDLLKRHEADSEDPKNPYLFDIEVSQEQKNFVMEGIEKIIWAGDMDGDGGLDMIVDDANHYNTWVGLRLYLSSHAKGQALFGLAGAVKGYGC